MFRFMMIVFFGLVSTCCLAEFRDPTQPAYPIASSAFSSSSSTTGEANIELVLTAIFISSQSKRATINGVLARQGQTIEVSQAPTVNPRPKTIISAAGIANKKGTQPKKALDDEDEDADQFGQKNNLNPLPDPVAKINDLQRQEQNLPSRKPPSSDIAPYSKIAAIPTGLNTVKIIEINKNSVKVDHNGELKTLQLVQRPYKITLK